MIKRARKPRPKRRLSWKKGKWAQKPFFSKLGHTGGGILPPGKCKDIQCACHRRYGFEYIEQPTGVATKGGAA